MSVFDTDDSVQPKPQPNQHTAKTWADYQPLRREKVQYALCLPCQKQTRLGLYKVRVAPVGDDYADW